MRRYIGGMPPVAVVTDTTHYLPREMLAANDIVQVSLYVADGGRQEREADMPDFDAFYERLRASTGDLPTTSQPSIGDFLAAYEPLVADGRDIVSIHLAGGISGTVQSARQAAAEVAGKAGPRIEVFDSEMAAGALGFVVLAASAAARAGASLDEVVARAQAAREALKFWFAVDTLEYLARGGRIAKAQAWLGGALKIKPILTVDGEITPVERVRTSGKAFERMVDYLRQRHEEGADAWVVQHIQAQEQAGRLVDRGREIFRSEPLFCTEVGPVIGAHIGPGLLGVGALPVSLLE
jgi:fatty acid kinase fatty acid binding subunit